MKILNDWFGNGAPSTASVLLVTLAILAVPLMCAAQENVDYSRLNISTLATELIDLSKKVDLQNKYMDDLAASVGQLKQTVEHNHEMTGNRFGVERNLREDRIRNKVPPRHGSAGRSEW